MLCPASELTLVRFAHQAMATTFETILPWGTSHADAAAADAANVIDRIESQLTVYRETSEVSRLNRTAAAAPVPVERHLFDLLTLCERFSKDTSGAFDVTAGPLIKAWGFYRRAGRVPSDVERDAAMACVGMKHVALDTERRSVRFSQRGVEINLGSIGKGYSLDRLAHRLMSRWQIRSALLHCGSSSVLSIGAPPNDPKGWLVGLKHPWHPNRRLAMIRLRNRAMATSGATFQHFTYNDRTLGHLLDPRTGRPAEGIAAATAFAPSAAEADALATAFYVLGPASTARYCADHPDVAAALLPDAPDAELLTYNLAPADVQPGGEIDPPADDSHWDFA